MSPIEVALKELELILEAKKNINSILTTMYSVFYSLEGFLLYGFYVLGGVPARLSIAFFAASCLVGLLLVTVRTQWTNDRCDRRGATLEREHGMMVLVNYDNSTETRSPRWLFRAKMHGTLLAVDLTFIGMWIALAALVLLRLI